MIKIVIKVIEKDLAPSFLVFFCIMGLGEFYIFAAVFGYFMVLIGGLLIFAYKMENAQMIRTFRVFLVLVTLIGFLNIFIDDMTFGDADNNLLHELAHGEVI